MRKKFASTQIQNIVHSKSRTDALMMALWASGIKKDEVITTSKSFIATIGAIVHVGAVPILVDVSEDLNINVNLIEKITKTKAIVPVHWTEECVIWTS